MGSKVHTIDFFFLVIVVVFFIDSDDICIINVFNVFQSVHTELDRYERSLLDTLEHLGANRLTAHNFGVSVSVSICSEDKEINRISSELQRKGK